MGYFDDSGRFIFDGEDGEQTKAFEAEHRLSERDLSFGRQYDLATDFSAPDIKDRQRALIKERWAAARKRMGNKFPRQLQVSDETEAIAKMVEDGFFFGIPEFESVQRDLAKIAEEERSVGLLAEFAASPTEYWEEWLIGAAAFVTPGAQALTLPRLAVGAGVARAGTGAILRRSGRMAAAEGTLEAALAFGRETAGLEVNVAAGMAREEAESQRWFSTAAGGVLGGLLGGGLESAGLALHSAFRGGKLTKDQYQAALIQVLRDGKDADAAILTAGGDSERYTGELIRQVTGKSLGENGAFLQISADQAAANNPANVLQKGDKYYLRLHKLSDSEKQDLPVSATSSDFAVEGGAVPKSALPEHARNRDDKFEEMDGKSEGDKVVFNRLDRKTAEGLNELSAAPEEVPAARERTPAELEKDKGDITARIERKRSQRKASKGIREEQLTGEIRALEENLEQVEKQIQGDTARLEGSEKRVADNEERVERFSGPSKAAQAVDALKRKILSDEWGGETDDLRQLAAAMSEWAVELQDMHGGAMEAAAEADFQRTTSLAARISDVADRIDEEGMSGGDAISNEEMLTQLRTELGLKDTADMQTRIETDARDHLEESEAENARLERPIPPIGEPTPPKDGEEITDAEIEAAIEGSGVSRESAETAAAMVRPISRETEIREAAEAMGLDSEGVMAVEGYFQERKMKLSVPQLLAVAHRREEYYRRLSAALDPARHSIWRWDDKLRMNDDYLLQALAENPLDDLDLDALIQEFSPLIMSGGKVIGIRVERRIEGKKLVRRAPIQEKDAPPLSDAEFAALPEAGEGKMVTGKTLAVGKDFWRNWDAAGIDEALGMSRMQMALRRAIIKIANFPQMRVKRGEAAHKILGKSVKIGGKNVPVNRRVAAAEMDPDIVYYIGDDNVTVHSLSDGETWEFPNMNAAETGMLPVYVARKAKAEPAPPAGKPDERAVWGYSARSDGDIQAEASAVFPQAVGLWEAMVEARAKNGEVKGSVKAHGDKKGKESIVAYFRTADGRREGWNITLFSQSLYGGHKNAQIWAHTWDGGKPVKVVKTETLPPPPKPQKTTSQQDYEKSLGKKDAAKLRAEYEAAGPADINHPYLVKKGVEVVPPDVRQSGDFLLVPVRAPSGEVVSYQRIGKDGAKLTAKGGFVWPTAIPGRTDAGEASVIVEGLMTAEAARDRNARIINSFGLANIWRAVKMEQERGARKIIIVADMGTAEDIRAQLEKNGLGGVVWDIREVRGKKGRDLHDVLRHAQKTSDFSEYRWILGDIGEGAPSGMVAQKPEVAKPDYTAPPPAAKKPARKPKPKPKPKPETAAETPPKPEEKPAPNQPPPNRGELTTKAELVEYAKLYDIEIQNRSGQSMLGWVLYQGRARKGLDLMVEIMSRDEFGVFDEDLSPLTYEGGKVTKNSEAGLYTEEDGEWVKVGLRDDDRIAFIEREYPYKSKVKRRAAPPKSSWKEAQGDVSYDAKRSVFVRKVGESWVYYQAHTYDPTRPTQHSGKYPTKKAAQEAAEQVFPPMMEGEIWGGDDFGGD